MWDPFLQIWWVGGPAGSKIQTEVGPARPQGAQKKGRPQGALVCIVM